MGDSIVPFPEHVEKVVAQRAARIGIELPGALHEDFRNVLQNRCIDEVGPRYPLRGRGVVRQLVFDILRIVDVEARVLALLNGGLRGVHAREGRGVAITDPVEKDHGVAQRTRGRLRSQRQWHQQGDRQDREDEGHRFTHCRPPPSPAQ